MSIKEELTTLKEEKEVFENTLAEINSALNKLIADRDAIVQKLETLKTKSSPLAKKILEKVQKELEEVNNKIFLKEKLQEQTKKDIEECQQNILLRKEDAGFYIEEQSIMMISNFLDYIEKHLEDIGIKIKETFLIKEITSNIGDRSQDLNVPTGNIGIFVGSNNMLIAISKDFYFKKILYTTTAEGYWVKCNYTEWYETYYKNFVSFLLKTLKKNYTYGDFFNLTIEDSSFTLELV